MILEALEKQRENIVQRQVAAGKEFKVLFEFVSNKVRSILCILLLKMEFF